MCVQDAGVVQNPEMRVQAWCDTWRNAYPSCVRGLGLNTSLRSAVISKIHASFYHRVLKFWYLMALVDEREGSNVLIFMSDQEDHLF